MFRDEARIGFIFRIAVGRHDHTHDLSRYRHLTQPDDDRRVDPAAQPDDEAARAGGDDTLT
jgi:hypothetical protein